MIIEKFKTIPILKITKLTAKVVVWCAIVYWAQKLGFQYYAAQQEALTLKKQTACPSLLSITRGARDTLIVMKAEPLCNAYVLETLQ
jgi:hypothetical protein